MSDAAHVPEPALRYDVNLSILFTELPLLQRPAAAAAAGFDAVELWWPFAEPVPSNRELDELRDALLDAGTRLVGLNFDAGNMAAGDRGLLSRPGDSERFRANIDVAVGFAASLGCTTLNALYGNRDPESSVPEQRELATENLVLAARAAERAGATVVIEALNSIESPDYPITSSHEALDLIDYLRVIHDVPNIAFLADLYHLARMGEPIEQLVERRADRFGHVQIADVPGRGQPGTGDIDWPVLLDRLAKSAYSGHVGLEYKPVGPSADSFEWLPRHLRTTATVEESV
ncbi:hydroxypyruvate isomerase family protein [Pseudonocardia xinjiangensis]|uniref:TIM barrel protein n=1 Tax=Pseudonocardia xinjiangensis TaxID=75289 RepID=A0ABX1R7M4_9PSEU|nr:TIM barrel protein [Pseudonocardia xinjiangensis]NMH75894.1 TIM barrel protein [Pseudonocardia xinjiangensis]